MDNNSRLAQKIQSGQEDIRYPDHKVLVQILIDKEPELFKKKMNQM